jgi:hypothetical protein
MSVVEYAPIGASQELVYRESSKGTQLWKKWQEDVLKLIEAKVPADDFLKIMTKKIYGEDKNIIILDKKDPYNALMNIKEHCKNKNFEIKISISSEGKSLLIAI